MDMSLSKLWDVVEDREPDVLQSVGYIFSIIFLKGTNSPYLSHFLQKGWISVHISVKCLEKSYLDVTKLING